MNQFVTILPWNVNFLEIAQYGKTLIDPEKTLRSYQDTKEAHLVVYNSSSTDAPAGELPLKLDRMLLSCLRANSVGKIHTDGLDRKAALNIPIANCDAGLMQWFEKDYTPKIQQYNQSVVTSIEDDTFSIEEPNVFETLIIQPTIVNTGIWHRIDNSQNNFDRYILTFRFKGNPSYQTLASVIKKWATRP